MENPRHQVQNLLRQEQRRRRLIRIGILVCMSLLGSMMSAVLLSDPRVSSQLTTVMQQFNAQLTGETATDAETAPSDPDARPAVRQMPTSRIPVRRAGDISG